MLVRNRCAPHTHSFMSVKCIAEIAENLPSSIVGEHSGLQHRHFCAYHLLLHFFQVLPVTTFFSYICRTQRSEGKDSYSRRRPRTVIASEHFRRHLDTFMRSS